MEETSDCVSKDRTDKGSEKRKNPYCFDDEADEPCVRPKIRKVVSSKNLSKSNNIGPAILKLGEKAQVSATILCTEGDNKHITTANESESGTSVKDTLASDHVRGTNENLINRDEPQINGERTVLDELPDGSAKAESKEDGSPVSEVTGEREPAKERGTDSMDMPETESRTTGFIPMVNGETLSESRLDSVRDDTYILCPTHKSDGLTADDNTSTSSTVLQTPKCSRRVVYMHSQRMIELCNQLPRVPSRAIMVHSLIEALGLLKNITIKSPEQLGTDHLLQFHSADYIEFLQKMNHQEDEEKIDEEEAEQYGLTFDCPVEDCVFDCASLVAGATVAAAHSLCEGACDVAINWCGGWHHAQRSSASGFCYINDIALGILKLREKFTRILYVDLDLHHGDGVENAFCITPHVLTVSFHKYAPGFFPGSGNIDDVGCGKGKFYSVNVPLHDGICDPEYFSVFKRVMTSVQEMYKPEAVVCQCGADGLAGDPMSSFNLSTLAYIHCVRFLLDWRLPLLLLGGGGYHHTNTARCWATLTALCVDRRLPQDVPEHEFFTEYGPDYEMGVKAGHRRDHNSQEHLREVCQKVSENLQKIQSSKPQVQ